MKKTIAKTTLATAVALTLCTSTAYADDSSCNSCQELSNISDSTAQVAESTSFLSSISSSMEGILIGATNALFGNLPDTDYSPAEFSAIPAVQNAAFEDQRELLSAVEKNYHGSYEEDQTPIDSYSNIFGSYLLQNSDGSTNTDTFDPANASATALFLNPSEAGYYTDEQKAAAETYIQLLSGAALSSQRVPDPSWLHNGTQKKDAMTRRMVSQYYTFNAMQSLIADNLSYIYGLNTGHDMDGEIPSYDDSKISESGLIKFIQLDKVENSKWYEDLSSMAISALLQEQVILTAGAFLELTRIEQLLRRQLATESASASTTLTLVQGLGKAMASGDKR